MMRALRPSRLVAAAVLAAAACGSPARDARLLSAQDIADIKTTLASWREASLAGDWPAFFGHFTNDVVWMSPRNPPIEGLDNLRRGSWFRATEEQLVPVQIEGRADFAFARGTQSLVLAAVRHEGTFLTILRRQQDGSWKIAVYSFSF